jgi:thioredoxin 1
MSHRMATLTAATLDEAVAASAVPLVVDLWIDGCGPCKALLPILERLAVEHAGTLTLATLKLDDAPDLWARFEVMTVPTLLVFVDGELSKQIVHPQGEDALRHELADVLPSTATTSTGAAGL